jgi:hypothetical protein
VLVLVCTALSAQEREPGNLNLYYRYPLAVAADLHNWNSFRDYGGPFSIFEFGGSVRYPLPAQPVLQPLLRGSFVRFDSLDEGNPTQWDHTHVFAGVGIAAVNRLARNFEIGAELVAGFSRTRFPNLTTEPVGYNNLLAVVTPRLTLLPSFNFAINVEPTVRYSTSLGPVDRFNGLSFSIGIGAEYRLGQDPDSPGAEIRSLQISQPEVDSVFAAMQSYYVNNPIGTVTIENVESFAVEDVRLSFFQNGYMDSPTPAKRIDLLEPGERRDVDLFASYNGQVFTTEGVQPLVGEVIISYLSRGRPAEQRESVVYDLHDKTALTWDDNSKMGSFITPADSAIRNYTSFVTLAGKDAVIDSASGPLQTAMLAYHALVELGVVYQVDPTAPFTQVQSDIRLVDSVSIPRDTLARLTGDCDDLTALYATMLETVGIETGFITTPGHIYVVFNTRVPARDYLVVHPDRDMFFVIEDEIWVPVEITMLGRGDFMDAWRFGADEWAKYENQIDQREMVLTRNAQTVYRSVGLREADLGLQYGSPSRIVSGFRADFDDLTDTILASVRNLARQRANKRAYNTLGIYAARLGRYDEARTAFDQASRMDSSYIDPRINLGALYYLQENYWSALRAFQTAVDAVQLSRNPEPSLVSLVYINLSKTQYALGNFDQAEEAYEFAARADPGGVAEFEYLASAGTEGARASEAASGPQILFADVSPEED